MRYAIIKNNIVENVIEANQEFIDTYYLGAILVADNIGPGYIYNNGEFIQPTPVEETPNV